MAAVSYDVVREILVRLKDVTTLFRCAAVCKGWRGLVAADDDSFLRRCLPEKDACHSPPFAGFFTQQRGRGGAPAPCFVPAPRPLLCAGRRTFLSSFIADVPAGYFDYAVPLTSRHGLLLVRLDLRRAGVDPDRHWGVDLAVCDLLAGTVHQLPRLDHYWDFENNKELSGYALLTAADCSSSNDDKNGVNERSRFFKVLIITIRKSPVHYRLHTFSSADESGWKARSDCVSNNGRGISATLRQHNAVVCGGVAHWLLLGKTEIHTLDVRTKTRCVYSRTMIHIDDLYRCIYDEPYLTLGSTGKLMLLFLRKDGSEIEIWTSHNNERSFQASVIELKQPCQHTINHVYTCLGEKSGMMIIKDNHRRVYIADLKTGTMQEVTDWPRSNGLSRRKTVPLEMDWPAFLASRLAIAT